MLQDCKVYLYSPYSVRIQENIDQKKTPYLDIFHAVILRRYALKG